MYRILLTLYRDHSIAPVVRLSHPNDTTSLIVLNEAIGITLQ